MVVSPRGVLNHLFLKNPKVLSYLWYFRIIERLHFQDSQRSSTRRTWQCGSAFAGTTRTSCSNTWYRYRHDHQYAPYFIWKNKYHDLNRDWGLCQLLLRNGSSKFEVGSKTPPSATRVNSIFEQKLLCVNYFWKMKVRSSKLHNNHASWWLHPTTTTATINHARNTHF
jgi:hypothetical protein